MKLTMRSIHILQQLVVQGKVRRVNLSSQVCVLGVWNNGVSFQGLLSLGDAIAVRWKASPSVHTFYIISIPE